jgi:TRAP transporter 4TM/12TM fusion protein
MNEDSPDRDDDRGRGRHVDQGRRTPEDDASSGPGSPSSSVDALSDEALAAVRTHIPDELPEELRRELAAGAAELEQVGFADAQIGTRDDMRAVWRWAVFLTGLTFSLFHLYTAVFGTLPSLQQRSVHLGFGLGLIFLLYPGKTEMTPKEAIRGWLMTLAGALVLVLLVTTNNAELHIVLPAAGVLVLIQAARHLPISILGMPVADLLLALLGYGAGFYVAMNHRQIGTQVAMEQPLDLAIATIGILLVLLATQRVIGTPLVVLGGAALLYAYFGQQMPDFFQHAGYSVHRIVAFSFLSTEAVFGTPIRVSSTFIYIFIIFAALLQRTGMERFFTNLAFGLTGGMIGGTAKVGVLTSAFSGTITGSSIANTVSNGAFTIPMMKKSGYKGEFAGAVEAASSTGGQLAPPVMGAGAFIMIEFTGLSLWEIIQAATIPAVLFFTAQFIVIHYESKRVGIMGLPRDQLPNVRELLLKKGYLLIPVGVIFVILSMGFSAIRAAWYAVAATVIVNAISQLIAAAFRRWGRMEDKLTITGAMDALVDAARMMLPIIAACATAGLIAGVVTLTGLGLQLSSGLIALAGETLLLTMFFTMVASLVLGIGLPTTANYVITATMAAPALLFFDPVPVIAAHMFVYYFGIMADITPPVCLAAYAASGIARSNPLKTGIQAVKIAIGGFLVPYMFVLSPVLLLQDWTWFEGPKAIVTALIGIYCVGTAMVGHIDRSLNLFVRGLLLVVGLMLLYAHLTTDLLGLAGFLAIFGWQWWTGPRARRQQAPGQPESVEQEERA